MDSLEAKLPPTLHPHPAATLYLDGIIFLVFDKKGEQRCHAAINTTAAGHSLKVIVFRKRDGKQLFPSDIFPHFDGSHANLKCVEPLKFFVESGDGDADDPSVEVYPEEGCADEKCREQNFRRVLDFEQELYGRQLEFNRENFAVLKISQGHFYSAMNSDFYLKSFPRDDDKNIRTHGVVHSCSLVGADIEGGAGKRIVLKQARRDKLHPDGVIFSLELKEGEQYVIAMLNTMDKDHHRGHNGEHDGEHNGEHVGRGGDGSEGGDDDDPKAHFLRYYDMFKLKPDEWEFFLEETAEAKEERKKSKFRLPWEPDTRTIDSPPCNNGTGGTSSGFPQP